MDRGLCRRFRLAAVACTAGLALAAEPINKTLSDEELGLFTNATTNDEVSRLFESCAACKLQYINDGICDRECNFEACGWDGDDCFKRASHCYTLPSAADYRGTMNVTASGKPCQHWFDQLPNTHTYTVFGYPDSGLGGHNYCRNPDPNDGSTGAWCLVESLTQVWEYCKLPPPSTEPCAPPRPLRPGHPRPRSARPALSQRQSPATNPRHKAQPQRPATTPSHDAQPRRPATTPRHNAPHRRAGATRSICRRDTTSPCSTLASRRLRR